jgi:hypothetical protein
VTLNVAAGTPTAASQSVSTTQGSAVNIALGGSDDDNPTLVLTYALVSGQGPTQGMITNFNPSTGTLNYTPNAGYTGGDAFEFTVSNGVNTSAPAVVTLNITPTAQAVVSGTVGITWGNAGTATLQTNADGLRLLPTGRNTDLPWLGIDTISITLSTPANLAPGDVTVTGLIGVNYGPVTISGSGTSYTITLGTPINAADRVTLTIANSGIASFTRRLDVLPGDVNDDGVVNAQDTVLERNAYLANIPIVMDDILGDGSVDLNDYNAVRRLVNTKLPPLS